MPATVLIVEDEKNTREGLALALQEDYDIYEAANADEAFRYMESEVFDVILTDLRMAGKSGLSVIEKAMTLPNKPFCIMMTAYGNVESAVEAMKRGAYDFLTKPINLEKLEIVIKRALNSREIEKENLVLHQRLDEKYKFNSKIIGNSAAIQKSLKQLEQVAPTKATVLLEGETGTGKELFAQMLHQNSPRARKPFIAVHCAALPTNLLESELFGHEKGAFTGATQKRVGRFEAANEGTLFLDEIGEIDLSTQVKLLRFLETKTVEPLGSSKTVPVDLRLICATNRNLEQMVKEGKFREDLFYRLNVIRILLPSLRERVSDIPTLLDFYISSYAQENGVKAPRLDSEALTALQNYGWPGNIRELRNFCEHLVIMNHGQLVSEKDLDAKFKRSVPSIRPSVSLSIEENEKRLLHDALLESKGNRSKAAEILGISRRTLQRKLEKWPELA
ncbi:MAG: transcriptional regulator [Verrucomicrobia bacterium]|nr:MAG: transcriptional regulator [Verrucomicrobiota bacterium]